MDFVDLDLYDLVFILKKGYLHYVSQLISVELDKEYMVHIFLNKFLITEILILSYHISIKSRFKGSTFHDFFVICRYIYQHYFFKVFFES